MPMDLSTLKPSTVQRFNWERVKLYLVK